LASDQRSLCTDAGTWIPQGVLDRPESGYPVGDAAQAADAGYHVRDRGSRLALGQLFELIVSSIGGSRGSVRN
jgi:hypothetical protein